LIEAHFSNFLESALSESDQLAGCGKSRFWWEAASSK
jgi:hypothetical protein